MTERPELNVTLEPGVRVEVDGSPAGLRHLAELLRAPRGTPTSTPVSSTGPEFVQAISVQQVGTMVRIRETAGLLIIEGIKEKLEVLADNVEYVASSEPENAHIHVEYYEDHPYLDAASLPLIVSRHGDVPGSAES